MNDISAKSIGTVLDGLFRGKLNAKEVVKARGVLELQSDPFSAFVSNLARVVESHDFKATIHLFEEQCSDPSQMSEYAHLVLFLLMSFPRTVILENRCIQKFIYIAATSPITASRLNSVHLLEVLVEARDKKASTLLQRLLDDKDKSVKRNAELIWKSVHRKESTGRETKAPRISAAR